MLPRVLPSSDDVDGRTNVLLCHDYAGNYHHYEDTQSIGVDEKSYTCDYLQSVGIFVYFSHKLVCVPPPAWTNVCHRNGVRVLGTLLCKPQTEGLEHLFRTADRPFGGRSCRRVFFPMAARLARLAMHYGFDGWLINMESRSPRRSGARTFSLCFFLNYLGNWAGIVG